MMRIIVMLPTKKIIERVKYGELLPENAIAPVREGYVFMGYYGTLDRYEMQYYNKKMVPLTTWSYEGDGE